VDGGCFALGATGDSVMIADDPRDFVALCPLLNTNSEHYTRGLQSTPINFDRIDMIYRIGKTRNKTSPCFENFFDPVKKQIL
jgi:hypothetical protein